MKKRKNLTEEQINEIARLHKAGRSRPQIAKEMGIPLDTIRSRVKQLQKRGVLELRYELIELTDDDFATLVSDFGLGRNVVEHLASCITKSNCTRAQYIAKLRANLSLWKAQRGRCYYTGARMTTDDAQTRGMPVQTGGSGYVFVTKVAASFRGKLAHRTFLRMVHAISRHTLRK